MSVCCVIGKNPQNLLDRLEGYTGGHNWVTYDCDIRTQKGLDDVVAWLTELKPAYVLVNLSQFDKNDCTNEKRLSWFFEGHDIPAQFYLPEELGIHNVMAIVMSAETGIKDLWSCPLRGVELFQMINGYMKVAREPILARTSNASM